jgi:hypothetical protein
MVRHRSSGSLCECIGLPIPCGQAGTITESANKSFRITFTFKGAGESQNAIILNSGHSGFRTAVIISAWLWN